MPAWPVERIGVAGAGTMGAGIAQVACLGGFATYLHDPDRDALAAAEERVRADLSRGADRGRWSLEEVEAASARLRATADLDALGVCDLVIEAAPESLDLKRALFRELEATCAQEAVLATNTSSLSVSEIAAGMGRPERVCGMHFFNPPALMKLVEVVAGAETSAEALGVATEVATRMGRTPVRAADGIGFLANRCARPFSLEALRLLGEGVADHPTIDRIVRLGGGYRMGPFELMDLVGIDVNLEVARSFFSQSEREPRWEPHPLQAEKVAAGRLGRKSGAGWYAYTADGHRPADPDPPDPEPGFRRDSALEGRTAFVALPDLERARLVELPGPEAEVPAAYFRAMGKHTETVRGAAPGLVLGRIVAQLVNEACFAVGEGVGTPDDVDTALRLGFNHPRGPFEWGRAVGAERLVATLDALCAEVSEDRYRVAPLLRQWAVEGRLEVTGRSASGSSA